ncbi:unnamed protein product [Cyclocybe aegerita]|uniref:Uncharacterized protein n=1 Tax=Cyclocybe aegerita TaxID=1973307 RepID=A0A8S0WRS1_CYCAE|nr:unnamed protein product [Cyclocybe aegerita]
MRIIMHSLIPFLAAVAISCSAAPIAQPREYLSLMTREVGELDARDISAPVFEAREELDDLELRTDDLAWLVERMNGWPGPGMKHKNEHAAGGVPTSGFHPVPENTYYRTHNNVYSGAQVNQYAHNMVQSIPHADPWNRKANSRLKSYPKPSTGFRNSEAANPAPNSPHSVAYHAPIPPRRSNTMPARPTRPGGSYKVGTDRVYGHRHINDPNLTVGVSYHDPKKPIPAPAPGGTPSRNHPFSVAQPKKGGPLKRFGAKIAKAVSKPFRPVKKALKRTKTL